MTTVGTPLRVGEQAGACEIAPLDLTAERAARMERTVRVLVVDDSAYVRKVVRQMLERCPRIRVIGASRDGAEALEMVAELNPDVVTLDLTMPRADGLEFIRRQTARRPVPVVILSSAEESGDAVLQALEAGAVNVVRKPTALATEQVFEVADDLIAHVLAAAHAVPRPVTIRAAPPAPTSSARPGVRRADAVVIGVSTGGPAALKTVLPRLPADFPVPVAVVIHLPVGYTQLFAHSLRQVCRLGVIEARHGDILRPGLVMLAPAGYHLTLAQRPDGQVAARTGLQPLDLPHRPSVDVLFRSAAEVYGEKLVGVVLTGMGADGTIGAGWVKAQGGRVLTEAEESCVVYGMPRSVVEAGLSDRAVPLVNMADAILDSL